MVRDAKALFGARSKATASGKSNIDWAAVDKALAALKSYDYGSSRAALMPIDAALVACRDDAGTQRKLERRLASLLQTGIPPPARDFLCRKLVVIGSADSVPALRALLADEKLSPLARSALERIPGPKAAKALRDSLPRLRGLQKTGAVISLGVCRDAASVPALAALLKDADPQTAGAAAAALGNIGTARAGRALLGFQPRAPEAVRPAVADACLVCAERLMAAGKRAEALAIYEALYNSPPSDHVQLAARRGMSKAAPGTPAVAPVL